MYSRFVFVEEHSGPAGYEPRLPGKPQNNQQREDDQHTALSKAHPTQLPVFVFDDLVCLFVSISLCATSKGLFQAGTTKCENRLLNSDYVDSLEVTVSNMTVVHETHLKPKNINCSHSQDRASISSMLGKAKPNQLAKLIMPPFSGKSLLMITNIRRTLELKQVAELSCLQVPASIFPKSYCFQ